jgi:hypothetical protein
MPKKRPAKKAVKSAKPKRERRDFAQIAFEAVQKAISGQK